MQIYTKNEIVGKIIARFGTLSKCAEELGIAQSTLSHNIKRLSPSFIHRLIDIGVDIDQLIIKIKEPRVDYFPDIEDRDKKINELRNEIIKLKAQIFDLLEEIKFLTEKLKQYEVKK